MQNRYDALTKKGGDTYQMLLTKKYLELLGVSVEVCTKLSPDLSQYDIVHLFNITRVHETYCQLLNAKKQNKKVVLSPIYHSAIDISNYESKNLSGIQGLIARLARRTDIIQLFKTFFYTFSHIGAWKSFFVQLRIGYTEQQKHSLLLADCIIPNTTMELKTIEAELFNGNSFPAEKRVVVNGVETCDLPKSVKMLDWIESNGLVDFAVCAGRIEPRKNQNKILRSLEGTPVKIVFAGRFNGMHSGYISAFKKLVARNSNAYYLGEITREELMTLYQKSKVNILASWFETTGLSGLEAGLFDCNVVVTEKGYTKEYYGDNAWYCNPENEEAIRSAVLSAFNAPRGEKKLREHILKSGFSWEIAAKETLEVYKSVLGKNNMDVSAVIVNYNSGKFITKCVESIIKSRDGLSKEIIVVDNASSDGSVDLIARKFPGVKIIRNNENLGFAKANNIGIKNSKGKYLLLMNPDTEITGNALGQLFNFLENTPGAGVVGPKLTYPDGSLQLSCRSFPNLRVIILQRTFLGRIFKNSRIIKEYLMSDWDHNETRKVDWLLAACLMFPRSVLDNIGLLNESYKLYFEDVDICYRLKLAELEAFYYPKAVVIHDHQRQSAGRFSKKTIWHIGSASKFFRKYGWKL